VADSQSPLVTGEALATCVRSDSATCGVPNDMIINDFSDQRSNYIPTRTDLAYRDIDRGRLHYAE